MWKIIRESFTITNNHLALATPLILFSLLSNLYLIFSASNNIYSIICSVILFFLMVAAFLSGWGYMIKKIITKTEIEPQNTLFTDFPTGVGEYFLPATGLIINALFISVLLLSLAIIVGKHFIGNIGITTSQFVTATSSVETMRNFILSLSNEQITKLHLWNSLFFCVLSFNYFVLMFYLPTLLFRHKNPFLAYFISIKNLFSKKILSNIILLLIVMILYMLISVLTILFGRNVIIYFVLTLLHFYFITFVAVTLFNYYYNTFVKTGTIIDKTV